MTAGLPLATIRFLARWPARLAPWRSRARRGSPRIAIVGNCQGAAIATALQLLLPDAEVAYHSAYSIARRFPRLRDLVAALAGTDVVFANAFAAPFRDGGDFETLRRETPLVQVPIVVFPAFHPDIVYVGDLGDTRRLAQTPLGGYNSAIALFGFRAGFSAAETLRLFRPETYRRLGYLGLWDAAAAGLLRLGQEAGYDLAPDLARWTRRGCFMHVINHPRMFVTNDLARGLLAKAGIPFPECDLDSYAADEILRLGSWPVYRGIAEQFGLDGSSVFLRPATKRAGVATIGLAGFVEGSFASYRSLGRARLRCDRVEEWLATNALVAELRAVARDGGSGEP